MPNCDETYQNKKNEPVNAPGWITTLPAIETLRECVECETLIAVDTESDSFYSYFEKVCLLQVSTHETDYIVDPLAFPDANGVATLAPIFANMQIQKIFHAAEYDILCLKRDYHFKFKNIFDTMIAARILGWKNVGLGSILQERFGIILNKKMQRSNWGHRPLTTEQISYASNDTHYLIALRNLQISELKRLGRLEEAYERFEQLTHVQATVRHFNPDAYLNITGAKDLDQISLGVLRELFRFRDKQARKENRPVFRVLPDSMLIHLATVHSDILHDFSRIHNISRYMVQRYGHAILNAINRGRAIPQMTMPHPQLRDQLPLDSNARVRFARLKDWRKQRATVREVDPDIIVSNNVLFAAARENPLSIESLVAVSDLGPWKAQEYGEEILAVLQK
ncbi:HRDC domain-containing protein [Candidatus Desantisbacteria bacterium]|nr:HRDC domain-containing protein [Candidatus Desantisbacteria bacterium]